MIGGDDRRKISQGGPEEEGRAVRPKRRAVAESEMNLFGRRGPRD
jgi:hypothetical protein